MRSSGADVEVVDNQGQGTCQIFEKEHVKRERYGKRE